MSILSSIKINRYVVMELTPDMRTSGLAILKNRNEKKVIKDISNVGSSQLPYNSTPLFRNLTIWKFPINFKYRR